MHAFLLLLLTTACAAIDPAHLRRVSKCTRLRFTSVNTFDDVKPHQHFDQMDFAVQRHPTKPGINQLSVGNFSETRGCMPNTTFFMKHEFFPPLTGKPCKTTLRADLVDTSMQLDIIENGGSYMDDNANIYVANGGFMLYRGESLQDPECVTYLRFGRQLNNTICCLEHEPIDKPKQQFKSEDVVVITTKFESKERVKVLESRVNFKQRGSEFGVEVTCNDTSFIMKMNKGISSQNLENGFFTPMSSNSTYYLSIAVEESRWDSFHGPIANFGYADGTLYFDEETVVPKGKCMTCFHKKIMTDDEFSIDNTVCVIQPK